MNKSRQTVLTRWLKSQAMPAKPWLRFSMLLGLLGGLVIILQAWLLASLLQALIVDHLPRSAVSHLFLLLLGTFILRAFLSWVREQVGFRCGRIVRQTLRRQVMERLEQLGPAWIQGKPAGSWATLILEQVENMQDYYSRYLPQMYLAASIPLLILVCLIPINWAAGLILFVTAPLIPLFMALVGMGAADANRRNFQALARLSGNFLDRLKGLETLRLFNRKIPETAQITDATENFRSRTMEVLRLAFLSSAILEFFTSISIAVVAVYFGFSYLGELNFGSYGTGVTLFAGFLALILAPEFFQPLRDLGSFYHAKAQAIGAAETLEAFLNTEADTVTTGTQHVPVHTSLTIVAHNLRVLSPQGKCLAGPLNFELGHQPGNRIALVGPSGAGKSSLLNLLLGFLPYQGSLTINGVELRDIDPENWRNHISWVGQNPHLPAATLRDNILLGAPNATDEQLNHVVQQAHIAEFLPLLPEGLDTFVGDHAVRLSVGQAQRIAVARALIKPCQLLLLDEPTASLDAHSEQRVLSTLDQASLYPLTLLITHQLDAIRHYDQIWVMDKGLLVQQGNYTELSQQAGLFATLLAHRCEDV